MSKRKYARVPPCSPPVRPRCAGEMGRARCRWRKGWLHPISCRWCRGRLAAGQTAAHVSCSAAAARFLSVIGGVRTRRTARADALTSSQIPDHPPLREIGRAADKWKGLICIHEWALYGWAAGVWRRRRWRCSVRMPFSGYLWSLTNNCSTNWWHMLAPSRAWCVRGPAVASVHTGH